MVCRIICDPHKYLIYESRQGMEVCSGGQQTMVVGSLAAMIGGEWPGGEILTSNQCGWEVPGEWSSRGWRRRSPCWGHHHRASLLLCCSGKNLIQVSWMDDNRVSAPHSSRDVAFKSIWSLLAKSPFLALVLLFVAMCGDTDWVHWGCTSWSLL
jgi:hypothetical protein